MANVVRPKILMDGPSHVTLHCYLESDGASGDVTNFVLLDPAVDLVPLMPRMQSLTIKQIWYEVVGFTATLSFNALTPWPFWTLAPGASSQHDWRFIGGLTDHSAPPPGLDSDGKLLLTTKGFTDVTSRGAFVLWMEKRNRPNPQPD